MRKAIGLLSDDLLLYLKNIGQNVELARVRRNLSIKLLCARAGITAQTYRRLVNGDPGVSIGIIIGVLSSLNLEEDLLHIADPRKDELGIALEFSKLGRKRDELDTDF